MDDGWDDAVAVICESGVGCPSPQQRPKTKWRPDSNTLSQNWGWWNGATKKNTIMDGKSLR